MTSGEMVDIQYAYGIEQDGGHQWVEQRQQVLAHLQTMKRKSSEAGVAMAERVASAAEALIAMPLPSEDAEREVIDTVSRSVDVMTLLVHDAGRRQQGYPPAALHEAVHMLLEQMERITPKSRTH
jgi:hypothetical protein